MKAVYLPAVRKSTISALACPHIVKNLLLGQDVQRLVGHADPHPTGLYDRRKRKITRNIVEGISI